MKTWDVFISHASKDKGEIATPLYNKLKELGLKVWYDEEEIQPSNEIIDKISYGLEHTTYFIIILSPNFIKEGKVWTDAENQVIQYLKIQNKKKIIPIYHHLTTSNNLDYKFSFVKPIASIYTDKESIDSYYIKIAKIIFETNLKNILADKIEIHELKEIVLKHVSLSNPIRDDINEINIDKNLILEVSYKLNMNFIPILNEIVNKKNIEHTNIRNYIQLLEKLNNNKFDFVENSLLSSTATKIENNSNKKREKLSLFFIKLSYSFFIFIVTFWLFIEFRDFLIVDEGYNNIGDYDTTEPLFSLDSLKFIFRVIVFGFLIYFIKEWRNKNNE